MIATKKLSKVAEAYKRMNPLRETLIKHGRCMEVTEDKAGIVWERWLIGKSQIVVFATPSYTEVFEVLTHDATWEGTISAIETLSRAA